MICVILAAGYATRLYPLTEHFPKPLLQVGGKTILDWLTEDLESTGEVREYVVVTNHRFAAQFRQWAAEKPFAVTVLDDGSTCDVNRLGAVRDIQFALEQRGIGEETLVVAGDNLLDFSLGRFVEYARAHGAPCVMRTWQADLEKLKKTGVARVDEDGRVVHMEEKPPHPADHWCLPPFYYYPAPALALIPRAIAEGCPVDAPGSLVAWMCQRTPVYAMEMPGRRYDVGTLETYRQVQDTYRGIVK